MAAPVQVASVVVVNKDDPRVADTLEFLVTSSDPAMLEVIVVDASGGRLDSVRRRFPDVTWIDYVHPLGKPRTIAEQRNAGITASRGEIVVFLDANCVPSEGWLASLTGPIARGDEAIVVGPIASRHGTSIHDRATGGGYVTECANMNVAFRRDVFEKVGLFDEVLGFAEDVDFSWRANDAGFRILAEPSASISHDWGDAREEFPRAFRYGVARTRLLRKHRARVRTLWTTDRYILVYGLFWVFLPVALVFPAYLLVLAYPLAKNRGNRPITLVSYHLVYALGALSELLHVPVLKGQRRVRPAAP